MEWGRQMEVRADRAELPSDPKALERVTLGDLARRYRDTVSPRKKTAPNCNPTPSRSKLKRSRSDIEGMKDNFHEKNSRLDSPNEGNANPCGSPRKNLPIQKKAGGVRWEYA